MSLSLPKVSACLYSLTDSTSSLIAHFLGVTLFLINSATPYSARKQNPQEASRDEASLSMNMWVIFSAYMEQGIVLSRNNLQKQKIFYLTDKLLLHNMAASSDLKENVYHNNFFLKCSYYLLTRIFSVSGDYLEPFFIIQVLNNRMRRLPNIRHRLYMYYQHCASS